MLDKITNLFHLLFPISLGSIVGFIISKANDYEYLVQPLLSPPKFLFPIMWTIIYILMGLSYYNYKKNNIDNRVSGIYYLQLFFNIIWSIIFFNLKLRLIAFIWIVILDILVYIMQVRFFKVNKKSFYLNIIYTIWISFATYLSFSIYLLN